VAIDVNDDGTVNIASADSDAVKRAMDIIKGLTAEPEVGAVYKGPVQRVTDFGAFVELMPGTDGLLHISEMAHTRVENVTDVMKEGDIVEVKVLSVEHDGKVRLTRRELLPFPEGEEGERAKERLAAAREAGAPPRSGGRDRGGRGGDRGGRGGPPRGPRRG
jgi:polyribonucleotide nucleotidyltransferase